MARRPLLSALVSLLLLTLPAAALAMQEGLWEITTTLEMPGMPFTPPPTTVTQCYTAEDVKKSERIVPAQEGDCKLGEVRRSGQTTAWTITCGGDSPGRGEGEITFQGENAYTGRSTFTAEGMTMTTRFKARRLGACP